MIIELLKRITQSLEDKNFSYMLTGSIALNVYSLPRMSLDIDIVVEFQEKYLDQFCEIFKNGYYLNSKTVKEEVNRHGLFNVIDLKTGFKVDFIVKKETEYRNIEFSRRRREPIADFNVWIVSPEDLIISKIVWIQQVKSDRQISDIENLIAIPGLDMNYIIYWCNKLNLNTYKLV